MVYILKIIGGCEMKIRVMLFFCLLVGSLYLFAQESKTLDGIRYTIIDPSTYAFNADSGILKIGQKYVIDGSVMGISGATLMLQDAGIMNQFKLSAPLKLDFGTKVTIYIELTTVTSFSTEAKIIKIEGTGISSASTGNTGGTRMLDNVNYKIIDPSTYAFNADSGTLQIGQKYVIDGSVMDISGATLMLQDAGIMNQFKLSAPSKLGFGANVRVYVEITSASSFSTEAKVIKIENR
jgi:hypothetical protein